MSALWRILEGSVGISALVAAAGYISLRAHLNHLGVSRVGPFSVNEVLAEGAAFFFGALIAILAWGILLLIFWILAWIIIVRKKKRLWNCLESRNWVRNASLTASIVLTIVGVGWVLYVTSLAGERAGAFVGASDTRADEAMDHLWYLHVVVTIALAANWYFVHAFGRRDPTRFFWGCAGVASLAAIVIGPVVFGTFAHSMTYHTVSVNTLADGTVDGLLVLENEEFVGVWRSRGGATQVLYVPKSQVREMVVGESVAIRDR